uniref:VQ domain-containing protein n=1 Tax=Leersia perrieri TaxID=77586 RepID=A0A0D9W2J0_9ORYZ
MGQMAAATLASNPKLCGEVVRCEYCRSNLLFFHGLGSNNDSAPHRSPTPFSPTPRAPVIIYDASPKIIHAKPNEFMALVQRLTGPGSVAAPPQDYPMGEAVSEPEPVPGQTFFPLELLLSPSAAMSPAARLATIEWSVRPMPDPRAGVHRHHERRRRPRGDSQLDPFRRHPLPHSLRLSRRPPSLARRNHAMQCRSNYEAARRLSLFWKNEESSALHSKGVMPNPNLKELIATECVANIHCIELISCHRQKTLPPFGGILAYPPEEDIEDQEKIDTKFYSNAAVGFPSLKGLIFEGRDHWKEWSGMELKHFLTLKSQDIKIQNCKQLTRGLGGGCPYHQSITNFIR